VQVGKYVNMNHTLYTVKRPLQEKVEKAAKKLKTTPDAHIQNITEEKLRKIVLLKQEDVEALS